MYQEQSSLETNLRCKYEMLNVITMTNSAHKTEIEKARSKGNSSQNPIGEPLVSGPS